MRRLGLLIVISALNHACFSATRLTFTLHSSSVGDSLVSIGISQALYWLLPVIFGRRLGAFVDRRGPHEALLVGSLAVCAGTLLVMALPIEWSLYVAPLVIGIGQMTVQLAAQLTVGNLGAPPDRPRNFGWFAQGASASGLLAPLVAGACMSHLGFRETFLVVALFPAVGAILQILCMTGGMTTRSSAARPRGSRSSVSRELRQLFALNVMLSMAWDAQTLVLPILAARAGLTPLMIGTVLSTFAAGSIVVRFALPAILRRIRPQLALAGALIITGLAYAAYPMIDRPWAFTILSLAVGVALGSGQPIVMCILHEITPVDRQAEAIGVRLSLVYAAQAIMPMSYGILGAVLGVTSIFWAAACALVAAGWLGSRNGGG